MKFITSKMLWLRLALPMLILGLLTMGCPEPGPTTYTVTLDANGGTAGTITTITVAHGGTVPTNTAGLPTRTNYTLAGWNTQADGKGSAFVFGTTTVTANITIFAQWSAVNYTVTLEANGGTAGAITTITVAHGGTVPTNTTGLPTRTGYTLAGWNTQADGKGSAFVFGTTTVTANITIYAKWTAIPISSISLPGTASVDLQATLQLTATVLPADVLGKSLTWTSSDNAIATVSSTGLVTGLNSGTATITATSVADNTKKATLTLTVTTYFTIPDANFRAALKSQFYNAFPVVQNDKMDVSHKDVKYFTGTIDVNLKSISSLSGIEYFTKLTTLVCNSNQLTSLDVSKNTALTSLNCFSNQLTSLDVSKNTALTELLCYSNQLKSLDVSKNTALTLLSCNSNQLASLDVSKNTALTTLSCNSNQLKDLDVRQNTSLTWLSCNSNQLASLDVSKNTALTLLSCNSNQLASLDVSKNTALTTLSCYSNQLKGLDVSQNTALTALYCNSNQLTSLDVSKNTALTWLWCSSNQLSSLDLRGMRSVFDLKITTNGTGINNSGLTSIKVHADIANNGELQTVKTARGTSVQIDTYTAAAGSTAYTKGLCDINPNDATLVAGTKGCVQ